MSRHFYNSTALAVTFAIVLVGVLAAFGVAVAPAAASHSDKANYTVILPSEEDHLPGDQNPEGATIKHNAVGSEAFADDAPEGFETFDRLELKSDEVDFSACDSENTAVFGIDRGNDNSGTKVDESLLDHMKDSNFYEGGLEVDFYSKDDFAGDPTNLNPEDAIVALQGEGSQGGPCFTMPTEAGWYQITGILEGTNSEGETVTISSQSHYFPICEGCHDEATAEEKLGKRPSESDETESTPTATPEPTATATPEQNDDEETATATATPEQNDDEETATETESNTDDEETATETESNTDDDGESNPGTPTPGAGPGFTTLTALLALLASALLARRL